MSYQQRLNPWVIHRLLPNLKQLTVNRFRRRTDAEAYLRVLRQVQPHAKFAITFESNQGELVALGE